jgi:hypothetical protein
MKSSFRREKDKEQASGPDPNEDRAGETTVKLFPELSCRVSPCTAQRQRWDGGAENRDFWPDFARFRGGFHAAA